LKTGKKENSGKLNIEIGRRAEKVKKEGPEMWKKGKKVKLLANRGFQG